MLYNNSSEVILVFPTSTKSFCVVQFPNIAMSFDTKVERVTHSQHHKALSILCIKKHNQRTSIQTDETHIESVVRVLYASMRVYSYLVIPVIGSVVPTGEFE